MDKSGWDVTQKLRVPFTYNWKYNEHGRMVSDRSLAVTQHIEFDSVDYSRRFDPEVFDVFPEG